MWVHEMIVVSQIQLGERQNKKRYKRTRNRGNGPSFKLSHSRLLSTPTKAHCPTSSSSSPRVGKDFWELNFKLSRHQKMPRSDWIIASTAGSAFQVKKAEKH